MLYRTILTALLLAASSALAQDAKTATLNTARGDLMFAEYFRLETKRIADRCLTDVKSLAQWKADRETYRKQLLEMLGLDPLPVKTDLKPVITGTLDHPEFTVEKLQFQSRPGLYVTGDLYIPKNLAPGKPAPTILYVCGHSNMRDKEKNISLGNKTGYQHHGEWFARNGYVCLTIDSLQLGEIEGIHHGTYRYNMWWWINRGYVPAGVEAWNCVRALDYLETRKEVDKTRFGVTGRSGGGAYSWWIAAIDDRIKAAVPVAGITDLQNHVVDGCVEGHCDCMYIHNTYQWDYAMVAALVAPRPLLISNSDKDSIFPLDGVYRIHQKVRDIYKLYDATDKLGLNITEGPHKDTQELRINEFVWFNRWLKGENPEIDKTAEKLFEPGELRVFDELPKDEKNSTAHEWFVARHNPIPPPRDAGVFERQKEYWMKALRTQVFRAWPEGIETEPAESIGEADHDGLRFRTWQGSTQPGITLRAYSVFYRGESPDEVKRPAGVVLHVLDDAQWLEFLAWARVGFADELKDEAEVTADAKRYGSELEQLKKSGMAHVYFAPRGVGPTAFDRSDKKQTQIRRRFLLLGQTLDGMQVWDIRRTIRGIAPPDSDIKLTVRARGAMAGNVLYASLFEDNIAALELSDLPTSHRNGPIYMNVTRHMDVPQALLMAATRTKVRVYGKDEGWDYVKDGARVLELGEDRIQFRKGE